MFIWHKAFNWQQQQIIILIISFEAGKYPILAEGGLASTIHLFLPLAGLQQQWIPPLKVSRTLEITVSSEQLR